MAVLLQSNAPQKPKTARKREGERDAQEAKVDKVSFPVNHTTHVTMMLHWFTHSMWTKVRFDTVPPVKLENGIKATSMTECVYASVENGRTDKRTHIKLT